MLNARRFKRGNVKENNMSALPKIAIGALGGTIAMVADDTGGVKPTLSAEMLIKSVPELAGLADIHTTTLAQLPSGSISFSIIFKALLWARQQVDEGADGVILTQGTDTLEEVSFLLALYWDKPQPLIMTGAMRAPLNAGADGPANLLAAVETICDKQSLNRGVMVVLNGTIHSPYWVRKSHSLQVETFQSGFAGPLGTIIEKKPVYFSKNNFFNGLMAMPKNMETKVALVGCCLSSGDEQLRHVFESGLYHGVVLAGFGSGHVSFTEADIIHQYARQMPVVMATRAYNGPTSQKTYGYKGAEIDLINCGVLMAGWLSPVKARLLLWALLASGLNQSQIVTEWENWQNY